MSEKLIMARNAFEKYVFLTEKKDSCLLPVSCLSVSIKS
jgi:hypothetical protein